MDKLVSIIMPSYNTGKYIAKSIESVIGQTYTDWELIIVDDCSQDDTDEVVKRYISDSRIIYIKNESNVGAAMSRNCALRVAKGRWIAFLDSDDLWEPQKLEKQICFMEMNDYHFSYTNYSEIGMDGKETGIIISGPKRITKNGFFRYCWPGCLTVMYDADFVGLVQIADIKKNNDYAMWLKVCKKTPCYLLDENLAFYRRGRNGSVSTIRKTELIAWHYKLFRLSEEQGRVLSSVSTCRNIIFGVYKKLRYTKKV